ncbi:type I DNA topoisomerase [bacterium]|nr:type I DNA topoisomerase [bacterium]
MPKNLVIVESPAKAKTIEKYLGRDYKVLASYGHVRDLPKSKLGIDIEHNFEPQYMIPRGSAKQMNALKKAVGAAQTIFLATDLDREGEAIAWHIVEAIPPKPDQQVKRITFSEITESAIKDAVSHPRDIDQHLVDAQQARRVLDRLVGYSLSPVLWKKIRYGLSAGRVQSVALKLIVDREREIEAFQSEEYWSISANLVEPKGTEITAELTKIDGKKAAVSDQKTADSIRSDLESAAFVVADTQSREVRKNPYAPFITSTLQRDSYNRLGYSTRRTMTVAQGLYEAGFITYMRTDSTNLSAQALSQAKSYITKRFGKEYALDKPRVFSKKARGAQEAHEAIRPTDVTKSPEDLTGELSADQLKLYRLIWQRTLASQMAAARYQQNGIDIAADRYILRANGREVLFDGFTKIYGASKQEEERILPTLSVGDKLEKKEIITEQHFTQPPARYSEATLVKKLEEEGVGRPSTYAPTISTIISRGYVLSEEKRLVPQQIGMIVSDLLSANFDFVTDAKFTAQMEDRLDDIADGKTQWQPVVADFYKPMEKLVEEKTNTIERVQIPVIETDEKCELCGKTMVIKSGRFGQFLACSGWPDCKNTKPILKKTGVECPQCHEGELVERKTKKGRAFYGCNRYPDCDYATWTRPKKESPTD